MPGSLPNNWLDALNFGTSTSGAAGTSETTATIGQDRQDVRMPPDTYHIGNLQLARHNQLLLLLSQYMKGGTRLRVLEQASNPFAVGEAGFWTDQSFHAKFTGADGTVTTLGAGGGGSVDGLKGAYEAASSTARNIMTLTTALGPVLIRDASTPIGGNLFAVQNNGASTNFLAVTATAVSATGATNLDFSGSTGTTATGTGTVSINGAVSIASGKSVTSAGGAANLDFSASSGTTTTGTGLTTTGGDLSITGAESLLAKTYSATSGTQARHAEFTSFTPGSGTGSFISLHVNPTINGTSSGFAKGLVVASKTNTLTGGTILLADLGTTTTDGFTGFTSQWKLDTAGATTQLGLATLPFGLITNGGSNNAYVEWDAGASAGVSGGSKGRIRYNQSTQKLQFSNNGAAYADIGSGGSSIVGLLGAYNSGAATSDNIIGLTTAEGPVLIRDASTPIGGSLFGVQVSGGAVKFLDVTATGSSHQVDDATTNAVTTVQTLLHTTTGTAANNIGTGLLWQSEDTGGNVENVCAWNGVFTTATNGSETSKAVLQLRTGGAALADTWSFDATGGLTSNTTNQFTLTNNQANSGTNIGFVLNSAVALAGSTVLVDLQNNGTSKVKISSAGNITLSVATTAICLASGSGIQFVSTTVGSLATNAGATRQFDWNTSGQFLPASSTDNTKSLGTSAARFTLVGAYQHVGTLQTVAAASSVTVDPTAGEFVRVTLSATAITTMTVSAGQAAQLLTVEVVQDGTGGRTIPTTWTNVRFVGGSYTASAGANAKDTLTFRYNTTDSKWDECARSLNIS